MEEKKKIVKMRSPNFPAISLKEAIEKVQLLYKADGRAGSVKSAAYKCWGYSSENGASMGVLSALKKYGLVRDENKKILLTPEAEIILMSSDVTKKSDAIKKCALSPEMYRMLWEEYKGKNLPSNDSLRDSLIFEYKFNEKSVDSFIKDFRETLEYAKLNPEDNLEEIAGDGEQMPDPEKPIEPDRLKQGKIQDYAIPRKGDKVAILRLEKPVSDDDIDIILKWLDLLRTTIVEPE